MFNNKQRNKYLVKSESKILRKAFDKLFKEMSKSNNVFLTIKTVLTPISLWNAPVGIILQSFLTAISLGVNTISQKKAEDRLLMIIETIYSIWKKQQSGETNYEAALICPDLFRNALIFEDEERVKEHLLLIEKLFTSGKMDFNNLAETLKLINQLSSMEYRLLKLVPCVNTELKTLIFTEELRILYETQKEQLVAAILTLINMNLVIRKLGIRMNGGPELGTIDFEDNIEYIRLSGFGQIFLKKLEEIKNETL